MVLNERNIPIRPLRGESFAECRAYYFELVDSCHALIKSCSAIIDSTDNDEIKSLARKIIQNERNAIRRYYADLKHLQRWWTQGRKA